MLRMLLFVGLGFGTLIASTLAYWGYSHTPERQADIHCPSELDFDALDRAAFGGDDAAIRCHLALSRIMFESSGRTTRMSHALSVAYASWTLNGNHRRTALLYASTMDDHEVWSSIQAAHRSMDARGFRRRVELVHCPSLTDIQEEQLLASRDRFSSAVCWPDLRL